MSSAGRKRFAKPPPRDSGAGFENIKAAKETFCDLTYQIRCLNELYNQLIPQTNGNHRRAGNSSAGDHQDGGPGQRDPKVLQQLHLLKANLRSKYLGNPLLFSPLEHLKVVVMFDGHKQPFFDFRLRPVSGYPVGYPFLIDDSEGTIGGLSKVIYQKVLKAVQEEEEEGLRGFGEGNHNNNHNNNSHAAEEGLIRVNIKEEVAEDEEELIILEDDSDDDESFNDELQQEESYNSQMVNPPPAAAADNNVVSRGQSKRQSEALPIKLEPTDSSIATIRRVGRQPSNRAPRTAPNEAPAKAAAASVAVPPSAAAGATPAAAKESSSVTIRVLQVNHRPPNTTVFLSKSKPQPQPLPPPHNNNSNGSGSQLPFLNTAKEEPTEDSSSSLNTQKRPLALPNHPLPPPPSAATAVARAPRTVARGFALRRVRASRGSRALASAAVSTSVRLQNGRLRSPAEMTAADRFYASSAYQSARAHDQLNCPLCEKQIRKKDLKQHVDAVHLQQRPYHCVWPGCTRDFGYPSSGKEHLRRVHGSTAYDQYLQRRD